ncbi:MULTISPECIES: helix-turn-helix domain-containing protein [unclassified Halomonas]|uniref:helix-turn-helix domain-containing protein n=1 Tax=unclassified Halomonas TaxID=2609666 RepID=UPI0007DA230A|nr:MULTISPECIES: helix-turn-helix domain-containing protein [unclassified Halomonas]MBT2785510.1 helix-turn-helix domain-containing protein [Halomonas sp. ISL-106]MBT2797806.1 helix-turn-helix domain-containing protein [Halomonas sp. ISL-104]OAL59355.1 MerR family transcriptional regulator [Halomonas sp. ALS9]
MIDISELSRKSGIPASKLRYYEEVGLIRSVGRNGLRRVFETDVLTRLSLIALGQVAGFSLTEMREMLGSERQPEIDRDMVSTKADLLDRRIKELTALRDGLRHVVTCEAPSHLECPTFQRLMRIAQTRQAMRGREQKKPLTGRKEGGANRKASLLDRI